MFVLIDVLSQDWPDQLPLIKPINETVGAGQDATGQYGWELDVPVVLYCFSFCVVCILILVQVGQAYTAAMQGNANTTGPMPNKMDQLGVSTLVLQQTFSPDLSGTFQQPRFSIVTLCVLSLSLAGGGCCAP